MSRCQWRPVTGLSHEHVKHMPGFCRVCWKPCFQRPEQGLHCATCLPLLATHGNSSVRRELALEDEVPSEILELLASDLQAAVSLAAQRNLGRRVEPDTELMWEW